MSEATGKNGLGLLKEVFGAENVIEKPDDLPKGRASYHILHNKSMPFDGMVTTDQMIEWCRIQPAFSYLASKTEPATTVIDPATIETEDMIGRLGRRVAYLESKQKPEGVVEELQALITAMGIPEGRAIPRFDAGEGNYKIDVPSQVTAQKEIDALARIRASRAPTVVLEREIEKLGLPFVITSEGTSITLAPEPRTANTRLIATLEKAADTICRANQAVPADATRVEQLSPLLMAFLQQSGGREVR